MEPQTEHTTDTPDTPEPTRPRLHRSRQDRILFGVCGGIAEYFGVDPTIVRLAFVVVVVIPPISALSLVGYPLLVLLMPTEETERLPAREALRGNVTALRAEVVDLAGKVNAGVATVAGMATGRPQTAETTAETTHPGTAAGGDAPPVTTTAEDVHTPGAATASEVRQ
jgi:phage shock protein PspC (stress-responsive transcriptional regulator)